MSAHSRKLRKSPKNSQKLQKRSRRTPSLTARENSSLERSLALLSDMRRGKGPFETLLRQHHLDRRTAYKHLGRDLVRGTRGQRVRPSKSDKRARPLLFPASSGDIPQRIRGSRAATKLSEFFQDRDWLLRGKMTSDKFEAKWRGVRIAGQEVFADAATIFLRAEAGDLKVETLYASPGGVE
jgi:hypothetical protein